jgi:regulator of replication initiation timing
LSAEKDSREVWINRYELEQKKHMSTHTELMAVEAARAEIYL